MAFIIYLPVVLATVATFLYYFSTRTFNYWKNKGVPGPEPLPFVGNLKDSVLRRKNLAIVIKELYNSLPNEKVIGIFRMTTPVWMIRDLDIVKHILIKDFDVFVDRGIEFSKKGLGANLFHADGDTWRVLRNRFTPIFTSGKLKNMLYLMTDRSDLFIDHVKELCRSNSEQEVHSLVQGYTITTIAACAFGLDLNMMSEEMKTLRKMDKLILNVSFAIEFDFMFPGILKKLNMSLFPKSVSEFFYGLVKNVVEQRKGVPSNRKDFMDLILELRKQKEITGTKRNDEDTLLPLDITDDVIAAQAFVFYVGGYETSATTMAFMLYELAKQPDLQEKVITEVDEVLAKYNGVITYDSLNEMTYLDKAFNETLRMYPIVDTLQRNAQVDYKIPGTNMVIKKGETVLISPYGIHHDERYYPNPEKFDPERFSVENSKDRHSCAYLPFGAGPRNCIGMRFAKVQSRVCMMKFFSQFKVAVTEKTQKVMEMAPEKPILGPKGGIYLNIIKR